jgi:hypothetical protein
MKRTVVVLTMLLALTMLLCGDVLARITPDNYVDPGLLKVQDEDHPWGGDQTNGGGPDGSTISKDYIGSFATDLNIGFFGLIYKMWIYRHYTIETTDNTTTAIGTGSLTIGSSNITLGSGNSK